MLPVRVEPVAGEAIDSWLEKDWHVLSASEALDAGPGYLLGLAQAQIGCNG